MTKPKQGPWFVEPNAEETRHIMITDSEEMCIAEVGAYGEEYANLKHARLLAAAPELFEALKGLLFSSEASPLRVGELALIRAGWEALAKVERG